jgi:hypothetical protein
VVVILDIIGYSNKPEDPGNGVPSNYKLELSANGRQRSFDRESFLEILKNSEHEFGGRIHFWTINDPSLCP